LLECWQVEDRARCETVNVITHYLALQIQDFLEAIIQDREPAVSGREGRKSVELFTAIYRAHRDGRPVRFPLDPLQGAEHFDGRLM
jgi:predicted dehydrogenase